MMLSREVIKILRNQCRLSYSAYRGTYRNMILARKHSFSTVLPCVQPTTNLSYVVPQNLPLSTAYSMTCVNPNYCNLKHIHISSCNRRYEKNDSPRGNLSRDDSGGNIRLRTGVFTNGGETVDKSGNVQTDVEATEELITKDNRMDPNHLEHDKEVDDFQKRRNYNIDKSNKYSRFSCSDKAIKRGEIIEDVELGKSTVVRPSNTTNGSQLIVRKADIAKQRPVDLTNLVKPGESEPIITRLLKETENMDEPIPYVHEGSELDVVDKKNLPLKVAVPKLYHIAPLVSENIVLRNLVKIGVDLSQIPNVQADRLIKMDFKKDVRPLLLYLHDIGVPGDSVAAVLTKNSNLLIMDLDHLKSRIRYLRWKKFDRSAIISMITRSSRFLSVSTLEMDKTLGFLQKQLWLTGPELRNMVSKAPRLVLCDQFKIQGRIHLLQDVCEFTKREVKQIALNYASILYKSYPDRVAENFDYLHNVMLIPHWVLIQWPESLIKRTLILKTRHTFLEKLGRAQYDPKLPNFVSLKTLLATDDAEFSVEIAKASLAEYNSFMRTV